MIKELIQKVIVKENLSFDESYLIMNSIMKGEVNNSQISALLVALKCKGEHSDEVGGFIKAMREHGIRLNHTFDAVDVCGTGGDNSNTFNISSAVSFIVAGAGVKVAKHGNRSISSKCGSSDVLTELGVNVHLSKEQAEEALDKIGITFLFAPNYHPAMKYVMPVRRELGFKTIFNILGPLTNPACTRKQLIGTFNDNAAKLMRESVRHLDMEKVCFVCTENKFDEITLSGTTKVFEYDKKFGFKEYEITAETFGYSKIEIVTISGGDPQKNSRIILDIFRGDDVGPKRNVVVANAAMALYSYGYSNDLLKCKLTAEESIISGKALNKLNNLIDFGAKFK